MKKTFCVTGSILFLIALSFTSCEKKTPEELLIGKWNMKSEHYIAYQDGVKTDEDTYDYDPGEGAFLFLNDGTGKIYEDGVVEYTFTWEINGDVLTISSFEQGVTEMDFTVSENDLTLTYSNRATLEGRVIKTDREKTLSR